VDDTDWSTDFADKNRSFLMEEMDVDGGLRFEVG
jgi:hypothetical protein